MLDDSDLRFHSELDGSAGESPSFGRDVIERSPGHRDPARSGPRGRRVRDPRDAEVDARCVTRRGACDRVARTAVAGRRATCARSSPRSVSAEIERSADLCCNICKAARRIYGHELDPNLRGLIQKMGDQAHKGSGRRSRRTSPRRRAPAASQDMDGLLDDLHRQFVAQIFESHSAGTIDLQVAVQLAVVARFYERIGDHAVNIGNQVRYLVDRLDCPSTTAPPASRDLSMMAPAPRRTGAE